MCCLTTIFLVLISRIAIIVWWLIDPQRFNQAAQALKIGTFTLPALIWAILGWLFLPWTTLAYLYVFPGGIQGFEWIILAIGFIIDISGHGGSYRHRRRIHLPRPR